MCREIEQFTPSHSYWDRSKTRSTLHLSKDVLFTAQSLEL